MTQRFATPVYMHCSVFIRGDRCEDTIYMYSIFTIYTWVAYAVGELPFTTKLQVKPGRTCQQLDG